jgi:hypothetical protein
VRLALADGGALTVTEAATGAVHAVSVLGCAAGSPKVRQCSVLGSVIFSTFTIPY